jgi:hypothetical protein
MKIIKPINLTPQEIQEVYLGDGDSLKFPLPRAMFKKSYLDIPDVFFENAKNITLEIISPDGSQKTFTKPNKNQWIWLRGQCNHKYTPFRQNSDTGYNNNKTDKDSIQELLAEKYNEAATADSAPKGAKSLIYYTAGGNKEYLQLLQKSVVSIWNLSQKKAFEFLFICPESWREEIEVFKPVNCVFKYHFVEDSSDGVEISKNKTKIFEFAQVNQYKKILYLDSDIIAVRNIDHIFSRDYGDKLYVACNIRKVSFSSHSGNYHGLKYFSPEKVAELTSQNQRPFNAGQFLFLNSASMKKHFENVNWLMSVWPGEYFFEQSFMNHYFCGFNLTENESIGKKIKILSTVDEDGFNPNYDHYDILVHFIAPALNPTAKINYIEEYVNAHLPQS